MDGEVPRSHERFGQLVPMVFEARMPTTAEYQAFETENRERAAAAVSHSVVRSHDGAERVWFPRDAGDLEKRLGAENLVVWADDDILHVLWRGTPRNPMLAGGLQGLPLWSVAGLDGVWEISMRVTELEHALISVNVMCDEPMSSHESTFRGSSRVEVPYVRALAAPVIDYSLDSAHLGTSRGLSVYRHVDWTARDPVVLVADGQSVHGFAPFVEHAVESGQIPPVALVGIHNSEDRHLEYLTPAFLKNSAHLSEDDRLRIDDVFQRHMRFVHDEVIDWIADEFGHVDAATRFVQGNSNGAAWALTACQMHPSSFGGAIGFSVAGGPPSMVTAESRHRYALAAGTLEPFLKVTQDWATALRNAGHEVDGSSYVNGHDWQFWAEQFPSALAYVTRRADGKE